MSASDMSKILDTEDSNNGWIVTFADMMTLILVFFILLYTLSELKHETYRETVSSVQILDGVGNRISVIDYASRQGRTPEPLEMVEDILGLNPQNQVIEPITPAILSELATLVENTDPADSVELSYEGNQINLQIDGRMLFPSGTATLKDEALPIFANLGVLFREHADYRIGIRGHTDDRDIETIQFPSNWELSAVRATTVLRYFIQQGIDPERMTATGYADFIPLVDNSTPGNRARNRRVEFVLEKETEG